MYIYNSRIVKESFGTKLKKIAGIVLITMSVLVLSVNSAFAADTFTVRPGDPQGWAITNQDLGAIVSFVTVTDTQHGSGALKFTTGTDFDSKAQISKLDINIPLSDISELSYWTYQNEGNRFNYEIPSQQLRLDMDGTGQYVTDFYYYPSANTEIVFSETMGEPYAPAIQYDLWQKWNSFSGLWASYQPIPGTFDSIPELTPGEGGIDSGIAGAARGGGSFYSIADILRKYPSAVVTGIGANLGVLYENSTSYADGISINNNVYDFEENAMLPRLKSDCVNNGWKNYSFINQGQCIKSLSKNR